MLFQKNRNELMVLLILVIISLGLRIILRNASLSVWDDVEYAFRVQHGSLYAHSPGYPGYMIIGRAFYLLTFFLARASSEQSLILLSAIIGGLLVIPTYLLVRTLFGKKAAIFGSIFMILNPNIADMSAQAMSDVASVFFVTLAAGLLYFGLKKSNNKILLIAAAVCGFSIAVRLTNLLLLPFFVVATFSKIKQYANRKVIGMSFMAVLIISGLIAYLPLLFERGLNGFMDFMTVYHPVNAVAYNLQIMSERTIYFMGNLINYITPTAIAVSLIGLYWLFFKHKNLFLELIIWISSYLLFFLLYGPTFSMQRFSLPVYPAIAALFSFGLTELNTRLRKILTEKKIKHIITISATICLLGLVFGSIIIWSVPTYKNLEYWSKNPFPTKTFALWVNETVPENAVIVSGEYSWVLQYYMNLPEDTPRLIWDSDSSWIMYSVNKIIADGERVFIINVQLEKCKFIEESYETRGYANYSETLSIYEILPKLSS